MSLVLALGIAIMLGRILARQVSDIAATANDVAVGALDRRVPTDGSGDAFDRLGQSINAMLERIDALVTQLRMMRSEEHTSELQSLMRNSYAVFCLKKKTNKQ